MTQTEALRLALEALENLGNHDRVCPQWPTYAEPENYPKCNCGYDEAITAIKAALEAKDEPVVWNGGVPAMLPKQKEGETFIVSYEPKLEAKDEPVAWMDASRFEELRNGFTVMTTLTKKKAFFDDVAIYATSPQRKPLTDEEIQQIFIANSVVVDNGNAYMVAGLRTVNIARAIEAAHGITGENNG